jgi:hypothetical protein
MVLPIFHGARSFCYRAASAVSAALRAPANPLPMQARNHVHLAGIQQLLALVSAQIQTVEFLQRAKPAIGKVSRWAQVFLSQSLLRPET